MSSLDSQAPPQANPPVRRPGDPRRDGRVGFLGEQLRVGWRWLTRMRTALYLLGVLALETIIATLVPQAPNVPTTVAQWRAGTSGPGEVVVGFIDLIGAFDVYGSPLFLATLLLLFTSLTACLIPRVRSFIRLARTGRPPRTRHLGKQEFVERFTTSATPAEVDAAARTLMARHRWRLRDADEGLPPQVAAEKGILSREGGSLVFHLSFYVLLVSIVIGQLTSFEGQVAVIEGQAITDSPAIYAGAEPGRWWDDTDHRGFTIALDEFRIDWVRDPLSGFGGTPTLFDSTVTITKADGTSYQDTVGGNDPLIIDGMKVHQLAWGYAPRLVVIDAEGTPVFDEFIIASETNQPFFRSAVKAASADPDIGLDISLFPFAPEAADGTVSFTGAPWDDAPIIGFEEYRGDLNLVNPQNVARLDTSLMESMGTNLIRPGQVAQLSDGSTVAFIELRRWVGFQMSYRPALPFMLLGALMMLLGLIPALYAYRRRLWIQAEETADGATLVTVAGRAFQRVEVFEDEHLDLTRQLIRRLPAPAGPSSSSLGDELVDADRPTST